MAYFSAAGLASAASTERIGVLLVNLGTPDAPTYRAVQRYLREFLSDRRVIDTPPWIWRPLLYGVVLPFRPLKTAANYRKIWLPEGSPLAVYSERLTRKVASELQAQFGDALRVELAMSYGRPSIVNALKSFATHHVKRLLVLPLYPHYCASTTGSVFDGVSRALQRVRWIPEMRFINDYFDDSGYIEALSAQIEQHWVRQGGPSHLMFSYHGIPASYVANGDPYQVQAEATTRLVVARLKLKEGDYSHCYQSRFGRVEWLKPYTVDTIEKLAAQGVRSLTAVSPSFAVDCLETLEEVAMEYAHLFKSKGGKQFSLVPGLNDTEAHVAAIAGILKSHLEGWV
jgi:protoporphyrin/coproporphyrin ferrochelatase